jgi:hypothetical protein
MCVAAMSLYMIALIATRKRGDGRHYFALWQTNNNTPNTWDIWFQGLLSVYQQQKIILTGS